MSYEFRLTTYDLRLMTYDFSTYDFFDLRLFFKNK